MSLYTLTETGIPGCVLIRPRIFEDARGRLVKTFHADSFAELGLQADFREEYYSVSRQGVLRGLHFQLPPHEHVKCVTCLQGSLFDVVVDLRTQSPAYRRHYSVTLDDRDCAMLYVPPGLAHGFYTLSETAVFLNRTTTVYNAGADTGIRWDSCDIAWPDSQPILSDKDRDMTSLDDFESPFTGPLA